MNAEDRAVARKVAIAAVVVAAFWLAWQITDIILLLFAAVLVAIALRALAEPVARLTGLSLRLALIPTGLLLLAALSLVLYLFGSLIRAQVAELIERLPEAWSAFRDRFEFHDLSENLMKQAENAVPSGGMVLTFLRGLTSNLVNVVVGLFLVVAGGIYLAVQPQLYRNGLLGMVPRDARETAQRRLDGAGAALRNFLKAQFLAMLMVGALSGIGLAIIGVPSAFALALFAGLAEFVPIIGPVAAAVPALLLALSVGFEEALWTLALFLAVQQLESNVISPLLQQEMVAVPAAVSLFAVVAFGTVLGPLGVLLATPLTVLAFALFRPKPEGMP